MKRVVATGTFDLLHPGHIYYLEKSRALGDELYVIVARDVNVVHKPAPVVPEGQRLCMIRSLAVVDEARLGDTEDMFRPIEEINPDVITLGFNQHFSEDSLRTALRERGIDAEVVRVGACKGPGFTGSRQIMKRILETRCPGWSGETDNTD
ncbi:FAD synthase [Methanogenium organophilum]|uniref:FAD synthase n=1 Tax=Methanogenium organophilum TaxID=2199 RepID=A0A9X9T758_METOG|nr:FAD synthase [Methanogenium organophilum]WAI00385.1 FAD synthase [Methanogenium organophilum]